MSNVMNEPVAIIGIGCRFPGGIYCPRSFWEALCEGRDAITEVPSDRWDLRSFYNPEKGKTGKLYTRKGGFLENIGLFDPQFFGISPREAPFLDPQQRLLLEVTWAAIEDGGLAPESLAGSKVGVFVGLFTHDFEMIHCGASERHLFGPHSATGMSSTIAANRISYVFDFKGPSVVVDTACSSSLVAVHMACRSLWDNESELALAGGVNVLLKPEMTMVLCKGAFLSPDGYCKSFDARADGYARSEGAGMVVLKRMSKALEDKDPIYALIHGSAVNQDGRSEGLTVPNFQSQMDLVGDALRKAGISPEKVQYVEAHGTGTEVGDPVEARALGRALSPNRPAGDECIIGSVKSNIGHTESAAGVAGLIKVALMLKHGQIPPNLHFHTPNPRIPFKELKLRVPTSLEPWPGRGRTSRIAGVNSFGFGGTNAHVVLEGIDASDNKTLRETSLMDSDLSAGKAILVPLSAHSPEALRAVASSCLDFLSTGETEQSVDLSDMAYTCSLRRGHHGHRLTIVAHSAGEFANHLEAYLSGEKRSGMTSGQVGQKTPSKLAFVFSGMGPQWWGMGRELLKKEPVFGGAIEACDAMFRQHTLEWSLLGEFEADENHSRMNETQIAQCCIFSLQVALSALWRSWGIIPDAIMGHSVGEIAAAHVAGVLSLEDAVRVCFHRGRLLQRTQGQGTMLAIELPLKEAERLLKGYAGEISIGAINSPTALTLSGDRKVLEEIAGDLEEKKIFSRFLKVSVPYHSPLMDPILPEFQECLEGINPQHSSTTLISTVTGRAIEGKEINAAYWPENMRQPVLFAAAFDELIRTGHNIFIEVSPHPVLAASMMECLSQAGKEGTALPSMRRMEPEDAVMLGSVGRLYTIGYPIDWQLFYPEGGSFVRLPPYPWQKEYYWIESEESKQSRQGSRMQAGKALIGRQVHPLLGGRLEAAVPTWSGEIHMHHPAYLGDHMIQGSVLYPAAAYLEMALAAFKEIYEGPAGVVRDMEIKAPLLLEEGRDTTVQFLLDQDERFKIYSKTSNSNDDWTLHATGMLESVEKEKVSGQASIEDIRECCTEEKTGEECYELLRSRGMEYGPHFQGIERVWIGKREALGRIQAGHATETELEDYQLHPVILDACFQVMGSIPVQGTYLPVKVEEFRLYEQPGSALWCHASLVSITSNRIKADIRLFDNTGRLLAEIKHLHCQLMEGVGEEANETIEGLLYEYQWKLQARTGSSVPFGDAGYLPSPLSICDRISPKVRKVADRYARKDYYSIVKPKLDDLCRLYIIEAFRGLGWHFDRRVPFTWEELAEQMGVVQGHVLLLRRLLEILATGGILKRVGQQWEILCQPPLDDPQKAWSKLLSEHSAYHAELTLLERCGSRLQEVLCGEADPLEIIFSDGFLTTEHLYRDAPSYRIYNRLMQQALDAVLDHLPDGQTLNILEIGAGTGSMSSYLLSILPANRTKYVFTDISQALINRAEQNFQNFGFVEYGVLDIEKNPLDQEFDPHSFDLILASDVFHTTSDLGKALINVKRLLASNGLLLLLELTNAPFWFDLVFGMLEGWWLFSDSDLRPSHPLLPLDQWINLLGRMGFSEAVGISDRQDKKDALHSLVIARGPAVSGPEKRVADEKALQLAGRSHAESQRPWLILGHDHVAHDLEALLGEWQLKPVLVGKGDAFEETDSGGFRIRPEQPKDIRKMLDTVCPNPDASPVVIYLWNLETSPAEMTSAFLEKTANEACIEVLHIVQALMGQEWNSPPRLWLITNGSQTAGDIEALSLAQTPLWGLGRVIVTEHPELETRLVDLSPVPSLREIRSLCEEILLNDGEDEIALRGKQRYIHRMIRKEETGVHDPPSVPFCLSRTRLRGFEGFTFQETTRKKPGPGEVEIQIHAAGINFKDVAKATGLLDDTVLADRGLLNTLGLECSGVITNMGDGVEPFRIGDEIMGFVHNCFSNYTITDPRALVHKPADLSFEEAATVPIAFMASYYALNKLARVQKGERVLIHTATGGVGLSAIQVARAAGAEVLATAGSPEKRHFLRAMGIKYIGDSRSRIFAEEVMAFTNGGGVDVVLNTLPAKTFAKSLSVLKPVSGRFIDLSNVYERALTLYSPDKGVSFFTLELDGMLQRRPDAAGSLLLEIKKYFNQKIFHPLPHRVFPLSEIGSAFRHMRKGLHIGKIVVSSEDPGVQPVSTGEKIHVRPDGTYLITGGLGGLGIALARWLVSCGARHLVLVGRSGAASPEARETVRDLRNAGVDVAVEQVDVTKKDQVRDMLARMDQTMPSLRGVVHAAMVLDDSPLMNMDASQMKKVMAPKVLGAWNMHTQTLNRPLDFFVCFSSFVSLVGNANQGNYAAANAFIDALAHYRRAKDLPALTVCWGTMAAVGYVARHEKIRELFKRQGLKEIGLNQAWKVIHYGLEKGITHMGAVQGDWNRMARYNLSIAKSPRFSGLVRTRAKGEGVPESKQVENIFSTSSDIRKQALTEELAKQVASILGLPLPKLNMEQPLEQLGFDSLMAVELLAGIETAAGIAIPKMKLLRKGLNVVELVEIVEKALLEKHPVLPDADKDRKETVKESLTVTEASCSTDSENRKQIPICVDNLKDEEVDAMLASMLPKGGHEGE